MSKPPDKISLTLEEYQAEILLDALSNLLCSKGLNNGNSEPNALGFMIEELIDILSQQLYTGEA